MDNFIIRDINFSAPINTIGDIIITDNSSKYTLTVENLISEDNNLLRLQKREKSRKLDRLWFVAFPLFLLTIAIGVWIYFFGPNIISIGIELASLFLSFVELKAFDTPTKVEINIRHEREEIDYLLRKCGAR